MNKITLLLLFMVMNSVHLFGQNHSFTYEYRFLSDSTDVASQRKEIYTLKVDNRQSIYFSEYHKRRDSTENMFASTSKSKPVIVKYYDNTETHQYLKLSERLYHIKSNDKLNWQILEDVEYINGFHTQKASVNFAGRKWFAFFTKDIPIADGPYKFHGLPGLIIRLESENKTHQFELLEVKSSEKNSFSYLNLINKTKWIDITPERYKKLYQQYRRNPLESWRRHDITKGTINGKTMSADEFFKTMEKMEKERLIKDNNILELSLLK